MLIHALVLYQLTCEENLLSEGHQISDRYKALKLKKIMLQLPKLRFESQAELSSTMRALGVEKAFSQSSANFSKLGRYVFLVMILS